MKLYEFKLVNISSNKTLDKASLTVVDPSNNLVPEVTLNEISTTNIVTDLTELKGTVTATILVKYTLSYSPIGQYNFVVFKQSSEPITNGILGKTVHTC